MRGPILLILSVVVLPAESSAEGAKTRFEQKEAVWSNVELSANNELSGRFVDGKGAAIAHVPMVVECGKQLVRTTSGAQGRFRLQLVKGGMCQIQVDDNVFLCRVWKNGTAPPNAISSIALVQGDSSVVRGNIFKRRRNCPKNCECQDCRQGRNHGKLKGSMMLLGLGGVAAYMALSRDNASE